jgi:hypothetical protein
VPAYNGFDRPATRRSSCGDIAWKIVQHMLPQLPMMMFCANFGVTVPHESPPAASSPWRETREPGRIGIQFGGVNRERQDAAELRNVMRELSTTPAEPPLRQLFDGTPSVVLIKVLHRLSLMGLRLGTYLFSTFVTWWVLAYSCSKLCDFLGGDMPLWLGLTIFFIGPIWLPIVHLFIKLRARPIVAKVGEDFQLEFTSTQFSVAGSAGTAQAHDLRDIESFAAQPGGVAIRLSDGRTAELPCRIPGTTAEELADKLNELAEQARRDRVTYRDGY